MNIDMRHLRTAKYVNTDGVESYTDAAVVGKAMNGDLSLEYDSTALYGDSADQAPKAVIGGKLKIGTTRLPKPVLALFGGHTYVPATTGQTPTPAEVIVSEEDIANEVGFGFCYAERDDAKQKHYYAVFIPRIIFGSPAAAYKTKGKTFDPQTPTLEGDLLPDEDGKFYRETEHASFTAALAYIDTKLGFTEPTA